MLANLPGKLKNEVTLIIDGREIIIETGELLKGIDIGAFAFVCDMPWFPGLDPEIDKITSPYYYPEAGVYIGGKLQMIGILYNVENLRDSAKTYKKLEIYSQTANMIDSSVRYPFAESNLNLRERCESQTEEFGINVEVQPGVDVGGKFARIQAKQTANCFQELLKLAAQRGLLLSCTVEGDLLIIKPNVNGKPIGTISESNPIAEVYSAKFNGRERYKRYEGIASSSKSSKTKIKQRAKDTTIPINRFLTFEANDCLPGEALNAAEWRKNKSAANALSFDFPVNTAYGPDGKLWAQNTLLTVISEIIGSKKGFTFLISQVRFTYNDQGLTAVLTLKPPTVYTTGEIELPWA